MIPPKAQLPGAGRAVIMRRRRSGPACSPPCAVRHRASRPSSWSGSAREQRGATPAAASCPRRLPGRGSPPATASALELRARGAARAPAVLRLRGAAASADGAREPGSPHASQSRTAQPAAPARTGRACPRAASPAWPRATPGAWASTRKLSEQTFGRCRRRVRGPNMMHAESCSTESRPIFAPRALRRHT